MEQGNAQLRSVQQVLDVLAPSFGTKQRYTLTHDSRKDIRLTSAPFLSDVRYIFGVRRIGLDPCAHPNSLVGARVNYFEQDDGLRLPWSAHTVYANPPFSSASKWIAKAHREFVMGNMRSGILLLPSRTHTEAFQGIAPISDIFFPRKEVRFLNSETGAIMGPAPFSLAILALGLDRQMLDRAKKRWTGIHLPRQRTSF